MAIILLFIRLDYSGWSDQMVEIQPIFALKGVVIWQLGLVKSS
jgi:hypothetical protein